MGEKIEKSMNQMKTIFIIIGRGFLVRNFLRSGVLEILKKSSLRVVILFPLTKGHKDVPESLRSEFEGENVVIEGISRYSIGGLYGLYARIVRFCVYSKTTWTYCLVWGKRSSKKERSKIRVYLERILVFPLSRIAFFKTIARFIEEKFFVHNFFGEYFEKYQPSLVFSTSIISTPDILLMKEARRRGVKAVSMVKSWDNVAKFFYRVAPDKLLVQNELMRDAADKLQNFDKSKIRVVGFPQFDKYIDKSIILPREEYFSRIGLDPDRKLIFFGSEGVWAPYDDSIAEMLSNAVVNDRLVKPCSLIIRPHFTDFKNDRFDRFANTKNVKVDDNYHISDFFLDNWDPSNEESRLFINLLFYADLMVTTTSTLTLDAACFDKPIINVAFNILYKDGKDISDLFYNKDHYKWVLDTGAVDLVGSESELFDSVNKYLLNPELKRNERKELVKKLCYKIDGKSSQRIVNEILITMS